jgi:hypothetical protein
LDGIGCAGKVWPPERPIKPQMPVHFPISAVCFLNFCFCGFARFLTPAIRQTMLGA